MSSSTWNSHDAHEQWQRFSAAAVRAFHRYATWLVSLSWWRFGWYALLLVIVTGLIQKLPPFSMTYVETIVESARHHKEKAKAVAPAAPAMPALPALPASAAPAERPEQPERPEKPEAAERPETPSTPAKPDAKETRTVNIDLPGITVNTGKEHGGKKGVNITFSGNGIHISTDEGADEVAAAASQADAAASAARNAAGGAKERAEAERYAAVAQRDAALAKAIGAKAAAEQARAVALGSTHAASAAAAQAASAAAQAASAAASGSETAVDMVVGGQHIRIAVPAHANADDVRDAVEEARKAIVESINDASEAQRQATQDAADAERDAKHGAKADDGDGDDNDEQTETNDHGRRNTTREHTVHYGNLPLLAVWWILGSMLVKITYKGRMQAEVKAAVATETAEAESLRRQVLEARMAMMQAQVEPHFLFNTLASIDHLIEFDPKRASQMQRNLISLLRASMPSMRSTDSGLRPLDLELAVVRPYLEILKVRMEERLTTEIDVPDGLLSAEFPPMMIQTLVENSIKHGLEPKAEGGNLLVKADIRHGKLCVTVSDTGLGFEAAAQGTTHGTGVGLANIRERLALLYGSKATLTIANNPAGGTIVTITVPYTAHTETPSDEGAKA
jgi:signal transduction histidine kinase